MDKKTLKKRVPKLADFELVKLKEIYLQTAQWARLAVVEAEMGRRGFDAKTGADHGPSATWGEGEPQLL